MKFGPERDGVPRGQPAIPRGQRPGHSLRQPPGTTAPAGVAFSAFDMPLISPILGLPLFEPSGTIVVHEFEEVRVGDS